MSRLPKIVKQHIEKARCSALSAVENYNKPGMAFRTRTYTILMVIAWTALFHAIFYRRGVKPWYVIRGKGRGVRYKKIDGEPKYWELGACVRQFHKEKISPERKNLEFMIRLRNKIEHRDHPELDPALYGECQSMLFNFEDFLVKEFGKDYALAESLAFRCSFRCYGRKNRKMP